MKHSRKGRIEELKRRLSARTEKHWADNRAGIEAEIARLGAELGITE